MQSYNYNSGNGNQLANQQQSICVRYVWNKLLASFFFTTSSTLRCLVINNAFHFPLFSLSVIGVKTPSAGNCVCKQFFYYLQMLIVALVTLSRICWYTSASTDFNVSGTDPEHAIFFTKKLTIYVPWTFRQCDCQRHASFNGTQHCEFTRLNTFCSDYRGLLLVLLLLLLLLLFSHAL